jgi:hypothetical protein
MTQVLDPMIQAHSEAEAAAIIRELHPDAYTQAFAANDGYDVIVWATEADSINDDGAKAIARYTVAAA